MEKKKVRQFKDQETLRFSYYKVKEDSRVGMAQIAPLSAQENAVLVTEQLIGQSL